MDCTNNAVPTVINNNIIDHNNDIVTRLQQTVLFSNTVSVMSRIWHDILVEKSLIKSLIK